MPRAEFPTGIATALGVDATFTWVPAGFLTEQGVNQWAGPESLPMWIADPGHTGHMARDTTASVAAGMRIRPLAETARRWDAWNDGTPAVRAGITPRARGRGPRRVARPPTGSAYREQPSTHRRARVRITHMRLLVLGGTVYLSKAVAELAVTRGHDVTVATRGKTGTAPEGVTHLTIDRDTPGGLDALRGLSFDAVLDVSRIPGHVKDAIDLIGDNAAHWTFISTGSVYNDESTLGQTAATSPTHDPTPDDSTDPAMDLFGPSKVSCEDQVLARYGESALIIRPGLIIGPGDRGDRFGYWVTRVEEGGEVLVPGTPDETVQYIDVRDLANWVMEAVETRLTGVFDAICPPQPRSEFLKEIEEATGATNVTYTRVNGDFLEEHGVNPWMGENSLGLWLPTPQYAGFMSRDVTASIEAGMRIRPLAETIAAWKEALTPDHVYRADLPREKEAEVLAAWHARD